MCLPDPEDTTAYKTWSEDSLKAYYDHLEDSFSIVYPKKCPYCYVKHLVVNAYHKFGEDAFDHIDDEEYAAAELYELEYDD